MEPLTLAASAIVPLLFQEAVKAGGVVLSANQQLENLLDWFSKIQGALPELAAVV
ncbi:hypothetical protein [Trichothermofontia sp.]